MRNTLSNMEKIEAERAKLREQTESLQANLEVGAITTRDIIRLLSTFYNIVPSQGKGIDQCSITGKRNADKAT